MARRLASGLSGRRAAGLPSGLATGLTGGELGQLAVDVDLAHSPVALICHKNVVAGVSPQPHRIIQSRRGGEVSIACISAEISVAGEVEDLIRRGVDEEQAVAVWLTEIQIGVGIA